MVKICVRQLCGSFIYPIRVVASRKLDLATCSSHLLSEQCSLSAPSSRRRDLCCRELQILVRDGIMKPWHCKKSTRSFSEQSHQRGLGKHDLHHGMSSYAGDLMVLRFEEERLCVLGLMPDRARQTNSSGYRRCRRWRLPGGEPSHLHR